MSNNINEEKVFELMGTVIDIEKKYLYDKRLKGAFEFERIKAIRETIDKEVDENVDQIDRVQKL